VDLIFSRLQPSANLSEYTVFVARFQGDYWVYWVYGVGHLLARHLCRISRLRGWMNKPLWAGTRREIRRESISAVVDLLRHEGPAGPPKM
jgi:hypothetical protein